MEKYKEGIKYIKIILIMICFVIVASSAIDTFKEIMASYHEQPVDIGIWVYPIAFVESIIAGVISNFSLVAVYVALLLASRSTHLTKLDESDFEKNKTLYRDTLKSYSSSVLNYIDNFKLDRKQSYTAKLLELEKNKIIKISGNKIEKIKEPYGELDKCFVSSINDNKVTMSINEYQKFVEKEALDKGLITNASFIETSKDKKIRIIITILFLLMFAGAILIAFLQDTDFTSKIFIAIVLSIFVVAFFIFFITVYNFLYVFMLLSREKHYIRTEKGKEVNKQLDGLKLFMEEFSNIDNKEAKYLFLWEDYLIYSVMFDINKKIQDEYSKYFN